MTKLTKLMAVAIGGISVAGGIAVNAAASSEGGSPPMTACTQMPSLWSGATEIDYDPGLRRVTFVWSDGSTATLRDTDDGCASQPGLVDELRGNRTGHLVQRRAACADLRRLVDAVGAERRGRGEADRGRVPVSAEAAEVAARSNPSTKALADSGAMREKSRAGGSWTIDLDESRSVLAACPG